MSESEGVFDVSELFPLKDQIAEMAPLEPYKARDGSELGFRRYTAKTNVHFILIHGSSSHSAYWHPFAKLLSESGGANVYAVDLRGHGPHPQRRGDIDYIDQLEDDLADLIDHIKASEADKGRFLIGGHSSGGGMALRFAGGKYKDLVEGALLFAPYLGHKAPMVKKNAGGWASPNIPKIAALKILSTFGIRFLNGTKVLRFNLPEKYHTGYETLEYSFRLMEGMHPVSYQTSLVHSKAKILLVVGAGDEAFRVEQFKEGILPYKPDAEFCFVEGAKHLGLLMNEEAMDAVSSWVRRVAA